MPSDEARPTKICASCGRTMQWRRAWETNWEHVRYCSQACRRRKLTAVDKALETSILALLADRPRHATICPSEAARSVAGAIDESASEREAWRELMEPTRAAARRLVAEGRVEIVQRGRVVDASTARGPIRIRLCGTP